MLAVVQVVAVLCAGLMAGLLFGDWLGPAFARARMSLPSFVEFQQIIHANYLKVLPTVSSVALFAPIVWLFILRHQPRVPAFAVLLAATIAIGIGFATTFVHNVPVNKQLESWNHTNPPANAREIWGRWESAHVFRTVFWSVGFLLEIVALVIA